MRNSSHGGHTAMSCRTCVQGLKATLHLTLDMNIQFAATGTHLRDRMLLQASASTSMDGVSDRILRSSMSCPHAFSSRTDSSLRILQRVKL